MHLQDRSPSPQPRHVTPGWLAGIGLVASLVIAPSRPSRDRISQTGGVRLLVMDDETGEPIEGAFIRIKGRQDLTTDQAGRVTLEQPSRWPDLGRHRSHRVHAAA